MTKDEALRELMGAAESILVDKVLTDYSRNRLAAAFDAARAALAEQPAAPVVLASIKIPTNTMEQEFQTHYRRGYAAGLAAEVEALRQQRDAAFAMSKCECGTDEACANLGKLHAEVEALRKALGNARVVLIGVASHPRCGLLLTGELLIAVQEGIKEATAAMKEQQHG